MDPRLSSLARLVSAASLALALPGCAACDGDPLQSVCVPRAACEGDEPGATPLPVGGDGAPDDGAAPDDGDRPATCDAPLCAPEVLVVADGDATGHNAIGVDGTEQVLLAWGKASVDRIVLSRIRADALDDEVVNDGPDQEGSAQIDMDIGVDDRPVITYVGRQQGWVSPNGDALLTKRAWERPTGFAVAVIHATGGAATGVSVRDDGFPAFSVSDGLSLTYVVESQHGWTTEPVPTAGAPGAQNALVVDAAQTAHLFYVAGDELRRVRISWPVVEKTEEVVDADLVVEARLGVALDDSGAPHVAYVSTSGVRWASHDGVGWSIEQVDGCCSTGAAVAVASDGAPVVAYQHQGDASSLRVARRGADGWRVAVADQGLDLGHFPSLALDAGDRPHVSHFDREAGSVRYVREAP